VSNVVRRAFKLNVDQCNPLVDRSAARSAATRMRDISPNGDSARIVATPQTRPIELSMLCCRVIAPTTPNLPFMRNRNCNSSAHTGGDVGCQLRTQVQSVARNAIELATREQGNDRGQDETGRASRAEKRVCTRSATAPTSEASAWALT
jgi:hypothetical protein